MKRFKKTVSMMLIVIMAISCLPMTALAANQPNDKNVSTVESEANDTNGVTRAPEYIRIKNTSGYNCYTTYGTTSAEGAKIACMVSTGDYLVFMDGEYDANGRYWVKGQLKGSHIHNGWNVWLLFDSNYMTIGY